MVNFTRLTVISVLISVSSFIHLHAQSFKAPCDPPVVTSPLYLCQNTTATPIAVTPSAGGTLNWYGTNATGGTASAVAPTPPRTVVGTTTYYVTQTIAGCESTPRTPIVVNVVADNGATILNFRCDPSQIVAPHIGTSVFFDWTNNPLISNSYNYTYTVQGGTPVSGNVGESHYQVIGLLPGQSVTLTLTSATHPCVPAQTLTCTVPCGTSTITPNFPGIASFCSGTTAPILDNTIASPNGVTGTWNPPTINNTTSGSYVFTPNPALFPCATTQTINVTVTPKVTPTFSTIPTTVCQNATAPILPTSSSNGITGFWTPATVNTAALGTTNYMFNANPGQCATAAPVNFPITITAVITPNFPNIPPICSGSTAPILGPTSPNLISGTWSPPQINTNTNGSYLFTPNAGQCATTQTLNVTIIPRTTPDFAVIPAFCTGTIAPLLDTTSPNGISGTWSPPTIDNTNSGSYVFTPDANECASTQTLNVIVDQLAIPDFDNISVCAGSVVPTLNNTSPNGINGTWLPPTIDNTTNGTYVFTPDNNQCATSQSIDVTINQPTLVNVDYTVTDAFSENQIITVLATDVGNYLYQLDFGPLQTSPIFENVSFGQHTLTVYDANGCSPPIIKDNVWVIGYPTYFTPNGDNYHDYWNITDLRNLTNSRIFIFDRYGKLLKQISPDGLGWDGTFIGQPLPSTDYWFTAEYVERNVTKTFKAHFSLKR